MTVLSLMRNRLRDTEKLLKIRKFFQQNMENIFWRLAGWQPCIQEKAFESIVCEIAVILSWTQ